MVTITEEQFQAYEDVRVSGVTNMWDTRRVVEESDGVLTKTDVHEIMKQYTTLMKEYPNVRQEV